jgi:hypothetical protein
MAHKQPYFPFYPDDWLSDEKLRACPSAARGLWIDMLSLMHKNDRRGYLQLAGKPLTLEQLARMTGRSTEEASQQLAELLNAGVPSVSEDGCIYSRRMVRDEGKRRACSEAGRRGGGNPALTTFKGHPKGVPKGHLKGDLKGAFKHPSDSFSEEKEQREEGGVGGGEGGAAGGFDRFWAAYPRKQAKQAARRAWEKLRPAEDLLQAMLAAVARQRDSPQWRDGVIPHPATWLNGRRWEDECATAGTSEPEETPLERAARMAREREDFERLRREVEAGGGPRAVRDLFGRKRGDGCTPGTGTGTDF